ncbi:hypothetical protein GCM10026983_43720 [Gracilibacillus alcaliphilus]
MLIANQGVIEIDFSKVLVIEQANTRFHWCGFFQTNEPWNHDHRINPDFELMIVTEGVLKLVIEGKQMEVHPGNMLLIPPQIDFAGFGDVADVCFYWVHFEAATETDGSGKGWQLPFFSQEIMLDNELLLIQQMQTIKQMDFPDSTLIDAYLHTLLLSISEKYKQPLNAKKNKHYLVDYMKQFLQRNYQRTVTVEEIAHYFGYNKAYISNLFSREVGETITQYLNTLRLEAARQALLTTSDSIREIANQHGFEDEKYFSRLFSKKYQQSPRFYRKCYGRIEKM